jgi:23S rRNA pseudouridine1911/1915/1917 synthase
MMAQKLEISAMAEDKGTRLDKFLSERFALTRSAIERLLEEGAITVSGGSAVKHYRLRISLAPKMRRGRN